MDYSEQPKSPEQGPNFVNNFDDNEDSKVTKDIETEDQGTAGLNENRTNGRETSAQNAPKYTAEEIIESLNDEVKGLKKENSDLLQELKSVEDMYEEKSKLAAENEDKIKFLENQIKTMGEDNETLKRKFESADEELREKIATLAIKVSQYSEIECEKQALQNDCDAQKKSVNELNEKIKKKDNDLAEREHEVEVLEKQCKTHKNRILRQRKFLTNYKAEIEGLEKVQEEKTKEIDRLKQFEAVNPALKEQLVQLERRKLETDKKLEQAENGIRLLKEEIRAVGLEKQNLLLRLSKLAGAKLSLDNPNIADLSDGKRPTKLSEEFSELYDNEWTDAFDDVKIEDERAKISFMLELLKRANDLCHEVSREHMNRIKTNICTLCVKDPSERELQKQPKQQLKEDKQEVVIVSVEENSSSPANTMHQRSPRQHDEPRGPSVVASPDTDIEQNETTKDVAETTGTVAKEDFEMIGKAEQFSDEDISEQSKMEEVHEVVFDFNSFPHDNKKAIMELRKFVEVKLSDQFEVIATDVIARKCRIDNETQNTVSNYITKCVNICWSMCRLDPPVYISFPDENGDMQLDTSVYKPYTKSGRLIDYIVWPALYLHEGGPLLSKGVAQGRI
ncbi:chromosome-associated kinesin KIF4-like isoform X2 [Mercenaria mercenaria]|uniref:chromosome-associated kinesin KIF4-like isoform X2 n=1 Tax=Mercenaria mercenaria TaxID=6596 RepID=UPI00234F296D|nr:chromosome-associated kinesin KIF4-like isoform X2 [Mercenaria mercenaria]